MKRRYRYMLNLFSLSLLAIALYLNFFKDETVDVSTPAGKEYPVNPASQRAKEGSKKLAINNVSPTFILK